VAEALVEVDGYLRDADGCEVHVVHRPAGEPDAVWVTEVFRDRAAHAAAMADPRVQAVAGRIAGLLVEAPVRVETVPMGGRSAGGSDAPAGRTCADGSSTATGG
jgi:quinol monooxygenase YgiN